MRNIDERKLKSHANEEKSDLLSWRLALKNLKHWESKQLLAASIKRFRPAQKPYFIFD